MTTRVVSTINRLWANLPLRAKILALLAVPLPIVMVVSLAIFGAHRAEQQARGEMQQAWAVRRDVQGLMLLLANSEAAVLEFSTHEDSTLLQPYLQSREVWPALAAHFNGLIGHDRAQLRVWEEVQRLIDQEFALLDAISARDAPLPMQQRLSLLMSLQEASTGVRVRLTALQMEQDQLLQSDAENITRARFHVLPVFLQGVVVGIFFQFLASLVLAKTLAGQIRSLETNARRFCQGLPQEQLSPDTREIQGLANELQQAADVLAEQERELRRSEERFRNLFKEAPIAYHEVDETGTIRHVNTAECALLGVEREELIGKYVWDTVSGDSREDVRKMVLERLKGKVPAGPVECEYQCGDRSFITVEIHENLIRDGNGRVIGLRSALLDVTARKMVDMAVRKVDQYARELRTKNEELLLAVAAAREASAAKDRFLAGMSHELRTPLNGIIGLSELLHDGLAGPVPDEHQEYLGDILASSRHLLQLVNDVLDLAKVESGNMVFRIEPVEIGPLLFEVRDVLRILAEKKHVSIVVTIGENLQTVLTDSGRLKQVVYNYLSNAIKFTPENSCIEIRALWEGGRVFRIEVEDTGPGIRESDVRRLFADFLQLDGTKPNHGTGLGLALTKRIVEGQGGIVGVRSTPGKGSVFYAILPIEFPPTQAHETIPEHRQSSELDRTTAAIFANIRSLPDLALVP